MNFKKMIFIKVLIAITILLNFEAAVTFAGDYYYSYDDPEPNYDQIVISSIITSKYNKLVRPNRQLDITLKLSFMQLVSLDEK